MNRRTRSVRTLGGVVVATAIVGALVGAGAADAKAGGNGGGGGGQGGGKPSTTTTTTTVPSVPVWAPAATAAITPGTIVGDVGGGECTANFVFYDRSYVYIGSAAHCGLTWWPVNANGCDPRNAPFKTTTSIFGRHGSIMTGTIVYNSWKTMQATGETSPAACAHNDFQLIRLSAADATKVNPSVPVWGGPVGTATAAPQGSFVYTFGRSDAHKEEIQQGRRGISEGTSGDGWATESIGLTASISGDSGSPFLDAAGNALGVLSTGSRYLSVNPTTVTNGVSGLANALAYLQAKTSLRPVLALGTEPFTPAPTGWVPHP